MAQGRDLVRRAPKRSSDTSTLKTGLKDVVIVYNSINAALSNMGSIKEDSTEALNGALADDGSLISYIKNNIRSAVFNNSSTTSATLMRYAT